MLQESLIYKFAYWLFSYCSHFWKESFVASALKKCGTFFRTLFSGSGFVYFIKREGVVNRAYEGSVLYGLIDRLINLPQRILHPLYKRVEPVLRESFCFKALLVLLEKLHLPLAGFLFVALVVPHSYWNNLYSTIAMTALLILYFIRTVIDGKTGFQTGIFNVFLVLFILCVVLAEVFSIMPSNSLRFLAFYLTCFMMVFILIAAIRSKKDMAEFLTIVLIGMFIAGVYGVYQQIIKVPVNPAWVDTKVNQGNLTRVYSFFDNPNNFGEVILLFLPFYFAAFFNAGSGIKKLFWLSLSAPLLLSLLFTQMRTAWIAFPVAIIVYIFFKEKRLIPAFIVLGAAAIPFMPQSILLRLRTITNLADSSLQTRFKIWQTVLPILKDYWFTGLGLGNETLLRVSKNYYIFVDKGAIPSHSHNLYLELWIETGFPGIVMFLAFIGTVVKKSIRALAKKAQDPYIKNILIAGLASLTGILVIGLAEYVWFYQRVMLFFWAVIGIMLAALNLSDAEGGKEAGVDIVQPGDGQDVSA